MDAGQNDERLAWLVPRVERARRFFGEKGRGRLLLQVRLPGQELAECQVLPEHLPDGWRSHIASRAEAFAEFVAGRRWLDDDWFPVLHPWFGAAELAGYLPNRVEFASETSWTIPEVASAAEFHPPPLDPDAPLLRLHLAILRCCRQAAAGRFLAGLRGTYAPMEVAGAVVGSGLMVDLREHPQAVDRLLDFGVRGAVFHLERQMEAVGMFQEGTVNGYLQAWMPGRVAAHVGNDVPCLISPATYRRFGLPADARVFAHFDAGQMHTHNLGWHQFGNFVTIPRLAMLEIAEDPNVRPTSERLPALFQIVGEMPVCLSMDPRSFVEHLPELAQGNALVRLSRTVGPGEAQELLRLARAHWQPS